MKTHLTLCWTNVHTITYTLIKAQRKNAEHTKLVAYFFGFFLLAPGHVLLLFWCVHSMLMTTYVYYEKRNAPVTTTTPRTETSQGNRASNHVCSHYIARNEYLCNTMWRISRAHHIVPQILYFPDNNTVEKLPYNR